MKTATLSFVLLIALFASACSTEAPVAERSATEAASAESPADDAAAPAAEPAATEADVEEAPADDIAASLLDSGDWCEVAGAFTDDLGDDVLLALDDPEALQQAYERNVGLITEAASNAPAEIADDAATLAAGANTMMGIMAEAQWDITAIDTAALEQAAVAMNVAGDNLERYNFQQCGIGQDPDA